MVCLKFLNKNKGREKLSNTNFLLFFVVFVFYFTNVTLLVTKRNKILNWFYNVIGWKIIQKN